MFAMKRNNWRVVISIIRFSPGNRPPLKITKMEEYRQTDGKNYYERIIRAAGNFFPGLRFCHEIEESLKGVLKSLTKQQNITR